MAKAQAPLNLDDLASFTVAGAAGDFVYKAGTSGTHLFLIQEGRIEILDDAGGEPRQIAVLEAGDFFGESALAAEAPRDASARAMTPYRLLRLDRAAFVQIVQESPEIAVQMVAQLGARLRAGRRGPASPAFVVKEEPAIPKPAAPAAAPAAAAPAPPPAPATPPPAPAAPAGARGSGWRSAPMLLHAASSREFPLKESGPTIVGRPDRTTHFTPDVDLSALDEQRTLSRRHATISRQGTAFIVQESATRNGTFVNGKRVPSGVDVPLKDGDVVRFGTVETVFRCR